MSSIADGAHDFDFLFGDWRVHHRQFRDGNVIEFDGESTTRPIAGGFGNLEEALIRSPKGTYHGAALRLFRPKTNLWSIWWVDGRDPDVGLPPVVGSFVNGVGSLIATDPDNSKQMTRFIWKDITAASARWEQAISTDSGVTWSLDWDMEFRRVA